MMSARCSEKRHCFKKITVFLGTSDLLEIVNDREVAADSEGDTHTHMYTSANKSIREKVSKFLHCRFRFEVLNGAERISIGKYWQHIEGVIEGYARGIIVVFYNLYKAYMGMQTAYDWSITNSGSTQNSLCEFGCGRSLTFGAMLQHA